ncbi:uncharacterized protein G2W53_010200 [Senna tora]|uniref:Uncharacterized protein n=1 Tax=Senna tora TaxID=362788 RepID=A0A834WZG2_9FABA|nr:uncharacterized protein G2W53_010200 [Senna tora]
MEKEIVLYDTTKRLEAEALREVHKEVAQVIIH